MFGKGEIPKQEPGRPIKAATINWPIRGVAELSKLRVGPGLSLKWLGGIPIIELASRGILRPARTSSAFDAATESGTQITYKTGTVKFYSEIDTDAKTIDVGSTDHDAINIVTDSIPTDVFCWVLPFAGFQVIVGWNCTTEE